jgi:hypothetical protein
VRLEVLMAVIMKTAVFYDVMPSTLQMKAIPSSRVLVPIYLTAMCHTPDKSNVHDPFRLVSEICAAYI